jgi:hypothetical protein
MRWDAAAAMTTRPRYCIGRRMLTWTPCANWAVHLLVGPYHCCARPWDQVAGNRGGGSRNTARTMRKAAVVRSCCCCRVEFGAMVAFGERVAAAVASAVAADADDHVVAD